MTTQDINLILDDLRIYMSAVTPDNPLILIDKFGVNYDPETFPVMRHDPEYQTKKGGTKIAQGIEVG